MTHQKPLYLSGFLSDGLPKIAFSLGFIGIALSVVCLIKGQASAFYFSYLTTFMFFLSISLGGFFFVLIQYLSRAGWSVVLRRIPELLMRNLLLMAILFLPIIFGLNELYHWSHMDAVAHDALLKIKHPYLNSPFFIFRYILYFAIWLGLGHVFF